MMFSNADWENLLLELNIQNIRRVLQRMLNYNDHEECFICNRLRCSCFLDALFSPTNVARDRSGDVYYNAAPPANTLPMPRWPSPKTSQNGAKSSTTIPALNAWIKASMPDAVLSNSTVKFPVPTKVYNEINYSWPPLPGSIWSEESSWATTEREKQINLGNDCNDIISSSVQAFFMFFIQTRINKFNKKSTFDFNDKCSK